MQCTMHIGSNVALNIEHDFDCNFSKKVILLLKREKVVCLLKGFASSKVSFHFFTEPNHNAHMQS